MICRHCGERFDSWETQQYYENMAYGGRCLEVPVSAACPVCGSSELVREDVCAECGETLEEDELTQGLCSCCARETAAYVREFWDALSGAQRRWVRTHAERMSQESPFFTE
ncbi:MAG: class I tRNA ligase family protein [Acutalibacteraceae bacterium]